MADYLVTGKKGNGKTLVTVARIREALRRAAQNGGLRPDAGGVDAA